MPAAIATRLATNPLGRRAGPGPWPSLDGAGAVGDRAQDEAGEQREPLGAERLGQGRHPLREQGVDLVAAGRGERGGDGRVDAGRTPRPARRRSPGSSGPRQPVSASSTAGRTIASTTGASWSSGVRAGPREQLALAVGQEPGVLLEDGDQRLLARAEVVVDGAAVALAGPAGDLDAGSAGEHPVSANSRGGRLEEAARGCRRLAHLSSGGRSG